MTKNFSGNFVDPDPVVTVVPRDFLLYNFDAFENSALGVENAQTFCH